MMLAVLVLVCEVIGAVAVIAFRWRRAMRREVPPSPEPPAWGGW